MKLEELGRRAVACPRWRWMPGMMLQWKTENGSQYRGRVCDTWSFKDEGALYCEGHEDRFTREELKAAWPDLADPATLGCLLYLVEEAYGHVGIMWSGGEWECWVDVGGSQFNFTGLTKQEALVNALERVEHWKG